jgi:hypothetical protein
MTKQNKAHVDGAWVSCNSFIHEYSGSSKLVHFQLLVSVGCVVVPFPSQGHEERDQVLEGERNGHISKSGHIVLNKIRICNLALKERVGLNIDTFVKTS